MPDIDIDFCMNRRGEVIEYVKGKEYGSDQVAQIITFNTMAARERRSRTSAAPSTCRMARWTGSPS